MQLIFWSNIGGGPVIVSQSRLVWYPRDVEGNYIRHQPDLSPARPRHAGQI